MKELYLHNCQPYWRKRQTGRGSSHWWRMLWCGAVEIHLGLSRLIPFLMIQLQHSLIYFIPLLNVHFISLVCLHRRLNTEIETECCSDWLQFDMKPVFVYDPYCITCSVFHLDIGWDCNSWRKGKLFRRYDVSCASCTFINFPILANLCFTISYTKTNNWSDCQSLTTAKVKFVKTVGSLVCSNRILNACGFFAGDIQ